MAMIGGRRGRLMPRELMANRHIYVSCEGLGTAAEGSRFPLPFVSRVLRQLTNRRFCYFLSKCDKCGRVYVTRRSRRGAAFAYPFNAFTCHHVPFNLYGTPNAFREYVVSVFSSCVRGGVRIFVSSFDIFNGDFSSYLRGLRLVLGQYISAGLILG